MLGPSEPRFTPLAGRSQLQDDDEMPDTAEDDRYLLSPCVTSPLLDDGAEILSAQSRCVLRWPCLLASAAVGGLALWTLKAHIGEALMWLAGSAEDAGPWGIAATVAVLAIWVVALLPISIVEVLVGHIFPLRTALLVCIAGKTLGAVGCFAIAQQAKPLVERLMRRHRRLRALERTVHAHPLKATLLVRFSVLPAPVKNYGWGSLGVDFRIFLLATLAEGPMYALPPVLLGSQLSDLADLAAGRQRIRPHPLQLGLGLALLLLLVLLAATSHRWLEARGGVADDTDTELVLTPAASPSRIKQTPRGV